MSYGPGRYDISFAEYLSLPLVSSSLIRKGATTGVDAMKDAFTEGDDKDDTKFMRLGRAAHCKVLTPLLWRDAFPVLGKCQGIKDDGKACTYSASFVAVVDGETLCFCGNHRKKFNGVQPLDYVQESELPAVEAIATKLARVTELNGSGKAEGTYIADVNGVRCKIRIDFEKQQHIADLKTLSDYPTPHVMEREVTNRGYDIQAALYKRVHEIVTGRSLPWVWVFQQTQRPYATGVMWADAQTIEIGQAEIDRVLSMWSTAMETGRFPDPYDTGVYIEGGVSQWKRREFENIGASQITFNGESFFDGN